MTKLTKKLLALGLCLTMMFSLGMVQVSADEYIPQEAWRLVDPAADGKIRLYAEPDVDSELLKTFWNETSVIVLEKDDMTGWIKIRIDEYEGFIHNEPKATEVEVIEIPEVTEEKHEVITEETEVTVEEITEVIPEKTENTVEEIPEEIAEVAEEELEAPAEEIVEVDEEETEAPTEEMTEEIAEVAEEETEAPAEEMTEEVTEVAEEETEAPTEEMTEEVTEVAEEKTEAPTEEITEVTEDETETSMEENVENNIEAEVELTTDEIFDVIDGTTEEGTLVYFEEELVETVNVIDDNSREFEGTNDEVVEILTDENEAETTELAEEPNEIDDLPTVEIWWDAKDVIDPGEMITLFSNVLNGDGYIISYQWQRDSGNGYENVEGATESTYSFPASLSLLRSTWRLLIDYTPII